MLLMRSICKNYTYSIKGIQTRAKPTSLKQIILRKLFQIQPTYSGYLNLNPISSRTSLSGENFGGFSLNLPISKLYRLFRWKNLIKGGRTGGFIWNWEQPFLRSGKISRPQRLHYLIELQQDLRFMPFLILRKVNSKWRLRLTYVALLTEPDFILTVLPNITQPSLSSSS